MPGVRAIISAEDAPGRHGIGIADHPLFAVDRIRYDGEPIVAIAAETLEQAQAAVEAVVVELEPLPAVLSMAEALAPDARWYIPTGRPTRFCLRAGPAPATWPGRQRWSAATPARPSRDPTSRSLRAPFGWGGRTISRLSPAPWSHPTRTAVSTSRPRPRFPGRSALPRRAFLAYRRLRCGSTVPAVGGGFGLKFDWALEPFAALLARAAGRPVRLVNSRQEEMLTCLCRENAEIQHSLRRHWRWRDRRPGSGGADGLRRLWRRADIPHHHDGAYARRQLPPRLGAARRAARSTPTPRRTAPSAPATASTTPSRWSGTPTRSARRSGWTRWSSAAATCSATGISGRPARSSRAMSLRPCLIA